MIIEHVISIFIVLFNQDNKKIHADYKRICYHFTVKFTYFQIYKTSTLINHVRFTHFIINSRRFNELTLSFKDASGY